MPAIKAVGLVQRTVRITRVVAGHPEGIGLSALSLEAGVPKATCLRILSELIAERWIDFDDVNRKYRVSFGMLAVVGRLLDGKSMLTHLKVTLSNLSDRARETAGFDLLVPPNVLVVAQEEGPQLITQVSRPVPRAQSVWITATGRVFLAGLPVEDVIREFAVSYPAETVKQRELEVKKFCAGLTDGRDQGFRVVRNELEDGASSLAAPVMVDGRIEAAVWIGGPTRRFTEDRIPDLSSAVMETAAELASLMHANPIEFAKV